eukprot:2830905-Prymnesium_polylepis.1
MAPEQVIDARSCTAAADVYSLGATWYACVAGRLPFDASDPAACLQQVLQGDVRPPSAFAPVPAAVEGLI